MASVLLRCGEGEGEGGEGGARVHAGFLGLVAAATAEAGGAAGVAEADEVGRFWKYCSPGSSSSRPPHGYAWRHTGARRHVALVLVCHIRVFTERSGRGKLVRSGISTQSCLGLALDNTQLLFFKMVHNIWQSITLLIDTSLKRDVVELEFKRH